MNFDLLDEKYHKIKAFLVKGYLFRVHSNEI